jgi:hypothetical protein
MQQGKISILGDLSLQCLNLSVVELLNSAAVGAYEMVMMPTYVAMFILDLLALKFRLVSIAIAAEKIQGLANKVAG